jgi:putative membrane protein
MGNGMGCGGLYMLIIFVLIVVGGIAVARWSLRSGGGENSALEFLKRRYAQGEVSKEQFEAMKKDIQ